MEEEYKIMIEKLSHISMDNCGTVTLKDMDRLKQLLLNADK